MNWNAISKYLGITLFFYLVYFISLLLSTPVSHETYEQDTVIQKNILGGEVKEVEISPDYSSDETWEDSLKEVGFYDYEEGQ